MNKLMFSISRCSLPANSLLTKYDTPGTYVDCYCAELPRQVPFPEYIFAFYTTPLFHLERFILKWVVAKPSTDFQARQLADGSCEDFAAWRVEDRNDHELLMCDFIGRTRSWLMAVPTRSDTHTRLYFGSAVVPKTDPRTGKQTLGMGYQALLGFHKIYSVLLLSSAKSATESQPVTMR